MPIGNLPFTPTSFTYTSALTTTATGATSTNPLFAGHTAVLVTNAGSDTIFVKFGTASVTAVVTVDLVVAANDSIFVSVPLNCLSYSAVCLATTSTVYITAVDVE